MKADDKTKDDTVFGTHSGSINVNTHSEGLSTNLKVRDGLRALQEQQPKGRLGKLNQSYGFNE